MIITVIRFAYKAYNSTTFREDVSVKFLKEQIKLEEAIIQINFCDHADNKTLINAEG